MKIKDIIAKLKNEYGIEYYDAKKLLKYCLNVDENYLIIHNDDELEDTLKTTNKVDCEEKTNKFLNSEKLDNKKINNEKSNLETQKLNEIFEFANQITNGKPLQYITKEQDFYGYEFYVDERVLIPQPDTEIVVDTAIKLLKNKEKSNLANNSKSNNKASENLINYKTEEASNTDFNNINEDKSNNKIEILDLCCGSGAIGISIKKYFGDKAEVTLADINKDALEVAKINTKKLNADCKLVQSDMFENIEGKFDLIVSNPPYIKTSVINSLENNVKNEPKIALDGGEDGLKFYKIISKNYKEYLNKKGNLVLEIGYDQKDEVMQLFENSECIKDFAGNDRVIIVE